MSLIDFLLKNRTPPELAKELAATAKENAALRDRVGAAETELFWMKVTERNAALGKCPVCHENADFCVCLPTEDGPGDDVKAGGES